MGNKSHSLLLSLLFVNSSPCYRKTEKNARPSILKRRRPRVYNVIRYTLISDNPGSVIHGGVHKVLYFQILSYHTG